MKEGWETKRLKKFCEFRNGLWSGKKPPFINVGVIRNTNFTKDGKLDDSNIVYLDVEQSQFAKRKLQYGDLILEKSGGGPKQPVGRVIVFDKKEGDFSFSNFTSIIRISNPRIVDFAYLHKFLYYSYISGATEKIQSHSTGIRNLKFDEYKEILIPIPPLEEQQQIVTILDKAFETIYQAKANVERNLQNAKELFQNQLNQIFSQKGDGYTERRFGDICNFVRGPFGGSLKKSIFVENGIAIYEQQHAIYDQFEQIRYFITDEKFEEMKRFEIKPGDLIMSCSGTMGKVAIVPSNTKKGIINQALLKLSPNKSIVAEYLKYWMESESFQHQIEQYSMGAAIKNVASVKVLKEIQILLPSIEEQNAVINILNELSVISDQLYFKYQKKKNNLEELKKSILQKSFCGELTEATKEVSL